MLWKCSRIYFSTVGIVYMINPGCKLNKGPEHVLKPLQFLPLSRGPVHKTAGPHWKQMDQTVLLHYLDGSLLLERISLRMTKPGRLSGKQMDTDVVFHFTGCLCLANSFSRRVGYVLSCLTAPIDHSPLWQKYFSNTNDTQSHKSLAAACCWGCMPTV